ncbi:hypothetical protein G9A89_016879 [Geosiphon pyriformis]|nr:hypothetical protein G9A89_016879 [Geosiphon pyriformis]
MSTRTSITSATLVGIPLNKDITMPGKASNFETHLSRSLSLASSNNSSSSFSSDYRTYLSRRHSVAQTTNTTQHYWAVIFLRREFHLRLTPFHQFEEISDVIRADGSKSTLRTASWSLKSQLVALKIFPEFDKDVPLDGEIQKDAKKKEQLLEDFQSFFAHKSRHDIIVRSLDAESREYLLVLQHVDGGTLHEYLERSAKELSWVAKLRITKGIANALAYLHNSGIAHRNLHPSSIFINEGKALIGDPLSFTFSGHSLSYDIMQEFIPFIDPQVLQDPKIKLNEQSDIYSFAMLMWVISSERQPFSTIPYDISLAIAIINGKRENPVSGTPVEFARIFTEIWNEKAEKRPDIGNICERLEDMMLTPVVKETDNEEEEKQQLENEKVNELESDIKIENNDNELNLEKTRSILSVKTIEDLEEVEEKIDNKSLTGSSIYSQTNISINQINDELSTSSTQIPASPDSGVNNNRFSNYSTQENEEQSDATTFQVEEKGPVESPKSQSKRNKHKKSSRFKKLLRNMVCVRVLEKKKRKAQ